MTGTQAGKTMPHEWVRRYLAVLGVEHDAPSESNLARLIRAHHRVVVFENITSLVRRHAHPGQPVPPPDPDALLANWESGRGGGVCYELAGQFVPLLGALGYQAAPIMGRISFPGSHQSVLVELDGRRYLAEVGVGAPFFEPIPLDGTVEVRRAGLAYRFHPDETEEAWVQDRFIDGAWVPYCTYNLRGATPSERESAYQRHHTPGVSWVIGSLTMIRCEDDEVFVLRNDGFTHFTPDGKRTEPLHDPADYARLAAEVFHLPALPIKDGLAAWTELNSAGPPRNHRAAQS